MDCFSYSPVSKNFEFNTSDNSIQSSQSLSIPLESNVNFREIAYQIIGSQKLPIFVENELTEKLKLFIDDQTDDLHESKVNSLIEQCIQSDSFELIDFKDDKSDNYVTNVDQSDENNEFYKMYHELIHSGIFTQSIMKFENSYSISIRELISSRDHSYQELIQKQTKEMENAMKKIGTIYDEENINALSMKHFEVLERVKDDWNNTISNLKYDQKQEFREWIQKLYEDYRNGNQDMVTTQLRSFSINSNENFDPSKYDDINSSNPSNDIMEESFTINLGAQLKTTHNLRLISMDILDLCRMKYNLDSNEHTPQRMQTAMSLYSNSLSALVLLVDNRINSYSGIKLEFSNICSQSTEFHFPDLESQMEESRKRAKVLKTDKNQSSSNNSLQMGDFYITRHSNLSEIHIVYHLVSDDSLRSSDINSRHPVILGLRNIMKISHLNDVNTITIPLLLIHEMTEEITIQWCLKRAELVLKCVKGFMIEMASLSSSNNDNRTVQFVVPKGISQELFSSLTTILPSIFRLSNPLVLRSRCDFQ